MASRPNNRPQRWCDGLPAVTVEIDCDGQRHRITWRRGKLVLEDHDLLAERSLAALGSSKPPMCVEVLDAWRRTRGTELLHDLLSAPALSPDEAAYRRRRYQADVRILRKRLGDLSSPAGARARRPSERVLTARLVRERRIWEMTLIDSLPAALRRALAASIIVTVDRRWQDEEYRRAHGRHLERRLTATSNALLEDSARRWRRSLRPQAIFRIESRLRPFGEPASCTASVSATWALASLSLPLSWFVDVWARGIALVDGCFVLALAGEPYDATSLRVVALRWERDSSGASRPVQAPAVVTRRRDEWSLRWL